MVDVPTPESDVTIDSAVVEHLLAQQCPALASLPLTPAGNGWDNALYRLGESLAVRLPRRALGAQLLLHELTWLPRLEPLLTVPAPQPVCVGEPSADYPYPWLVVPWFNGVPASDIDVSHRTGFAEQLADFLWALHVPAPPTAPLNPFRGLSLTAAQGPDARVRERLMREPDSAPLLSRWEAWSQAEEFDGVEVWLHGDLHPGNLITNESGSLTAVIDWGDLTAGDPACDLATAWLTFDADGRAAFIERLSQGGAADAATWQRAKAWALHLALLLAQECDPGSPLQATGAQAVASLREEPLSHPERCHP